MRARGIIVLVKSETHKGLKRVTLICLLCPMLVIIHFRKYHIWNKKKRYRRLHLPVNARAQNMFSRDVKRLSFRRQTLKFSRLNVKFPL